MASISLGSPLFNGGIRTPEIHVDVLFPRTSGLDGKLNGKKTVEAV
jgi:hypothetical protein